MRRAAAAGLFVAIVLGLLVGGHAYLIRRLVLDPGWPEPWRSLGVWLLAGLGALLVLAPIAERTLPRTLARGSTWPSALWMGAWFLLLMTLGASEGILAISGAPALASEGGRGALESTAAIRAIAVVGVAFALSAAGLRGALRPPQVKRVEIALARWPRALDGFRIVQITDLHIGPILDRRFASEVVRRVNALHPDLIALTGDLVDGREPLLRDEVAPLARLAAPRGVFLVPGNHDYYSGIDAWMGRARSLGLRVLRNARVTIGSPGARFDLVGVNDHRASFTHPEQAEDLDAALEDRDPERPWILLAHDPESFHAAARAGVDLQISGHTHGGQVWPFRYLVRLATPFVAGRYRRGRSQLYVSCGTGFWGPPMRLGAPAEITEIVLRASTDQV
ncbi:MAG: metallophosphoesterase [Myxococcota bacterium]